MSLPFQPVPKPQYKRMKKTAKQRGYIPLKASEKAKERAKGRCEWCGWSPGNYDPTERKMGLQRAHLVRRWKCESVTENDIAILCGPSVNSDTCHWKVDYTESGRKWAEQYREKLLGSTLRR